MCTKDEELILLKQLSEGGYAAFDTLFMFYQPKVKAFLKGFIKVDEEASDMTQEIFYKIWINRESIAQVISFKSYLFRMARNMIYDYFEHSLVRQNYEKKLLDKPQYTDLIEDEFHAKELEILIDISIEQMPEQRKRIFKMSRKDGLSNEEIAHRLEINKRTVENHITQALSDLRKAIKSAYILLL